MQPGKWQWQMYKGITIIPPREEATRRLVSQQSEEAMKAQPDEKTIQTIPDFDIFILMFL